MKPEKQRVVLELFRRGWYCTREGDVFRPTEPVRYVKNNKGYFSVRFNHQRFYVHQMVWLFFFKKIPSGLEINHKDSNKLNNSIENLEVCTHAENIRHSIRNGRQTFIGARGEKSHSAKLRDSEVDEIRFLFNHGYPQVEIAGAYGVSKTLTHNICHGKRRC